MHLHPKVQAEMDTSEETNEEGLVDSTNVFLERGEDQKENPIALYAVTDDEGEAIGWVEYYTDKDNPLPDDISKNLSLTPEDLVLQVSYEKLLSEGWPEYLLHIDRELSEAVLNTDRKGVIVSGLRQTMLDLRRKENFISSQSAEPPRRIVIYAYTDLDNKASEKVLEKNGFALDETIRTYHEEPNAKEPTGKPNHLWYKELKDSEPQ